MNSQAAVAAVIVQQGKLLDFIDQVTQRDETPEEYVRQEIAKSLVREYRYPRTDIGVEFVVRVGSRKPRADLVIFEEGKSHRQDLARIIVECKHAGIKSTDRKDGVGQLQSYMSACPNVTYGMWTNGLERYCYRKIVQHGNIRYDEVPDIPAFGESEEETERPRFDQLKAASSDALLFAFRRCHNYIAGNQGLQKPEAFWELLKLIFCKIRDERSDEVNFYATSAERQSLNGQLKVKSRLDRLFKQVKGEYPQIFKPGEELDLNPPVLAFLVTQLQMYSLLDSDIDVKGKAYEEVVGSNLRGDRGEFFTPRNVCRLAVGLLNPTENELLLDPAAGTGGFLITAMNYVMHRIEQVEIGKWNDADRAGKATEERFRHYLATNVIGIDLNPNLVKAAKMNMVMNNDGSGGLYQANSLEAPARWDDELRKRQLMGVVDVLVTNPPFGSKIPVDDDAILETYDLGHQWTYDPDADHWVIGKGIQRSQPPEILFIERCVRFLKPGTGRAVMVLPDGILGSPGLGYVRQWLLQETRILASIDLHPDTFQPSTSVQTSLLAFQRKSAAEIAVEAGSGTANDYDIFMAVADHIGHDKRGNITYVRDPDGNEILEEVEERVRDFVDGHPVYRTHRFHRKKVDDTTTAIAAAFREWRSTQT